MATPTALRIDIVQHPAERKHAFNTARLVQRMLGGAHLHIAWPHGARMTARVPLADDAVLLFPGDDARPLDAWTRPPSQLVVLDGTWTQVKRLRHDNPWLHDLPLLGLSPTTPSRYRIREEPAAHCLSTLEAVALVLRAWEPDSTAPAELLAAFEGMVDRHLAAERPARARHKARRRASLMQRLADLDDVVVVYAEEVGRQQGQPRLLQWAAVRPASGEVFDQLVSLPVANPCVRASMGLADEPADGSLRALASAWRRWRRPGDQLFAWMPSVRQLAERSGVARDVHGLKPLVGRLRGRSRGRLDQIVAREGLEVQAVPVRGRAAQRLGAAVALARWLGGASQG